MITDQSSDLRAGVPAHQPEPGESSTRSCRSEGYLPPLRPHPIFSLLSTPISILITSFVLFTSCTSPTPPPPPPPPPASPDTTSHDFIWQIDTLGDGNSSVLYDVAIINDTTIWAVGEIYLKDSTGQVDPDAYNLAKWSGGKWQMVRVPTATYGGFVSTAVLTTIWAFGRDDVWTFSIAGSYSRWNGNAWSTAFVPERSGSVTKLWGSSSSNLYAVGTNGSISHFDGTTWRRIESGTSLTLSDVFGLEGSAHVEALVYIVAGDLYSSGSSRIVSIRGTTISDTSLSLPNFTLHSLWADPLRGVYASGEGLWQYDKGDWSQHLDAVFLNRVRGTTPNNIFSAGSGFMLFHFNGSSWHRFSKLEQANAVWRGLDARGSLVVTVGDVGSTVVVLRGRRLD